MASEKHSTKPETNEDQKPHRKFYRRKAFWLFLVLALATVFLGSLNVALNNRGVQRWVADLLYASQRIHVEFEDLSVQALWGSVSGTNISVIDERSNVNLTLNEFDVSFNPLWLVMGRFKVTQVEAKELFLDTSLFIHQDGPAPAAKPPYFLKRIKLRHARVENLYWRQTSERYIVIHDVVVESKFGSIFFKSPTLLTVNGFRFIDPQVHLFVDRIEQNGFFIFDFTQPRFFDESKLYTNIKVSDLLFSIRKTAKPWLTERLWDEDLTPVLTRYYGAEVPKDRSYLYLREILLDMEKNGEKIHVNTLKLAVEDATLFFAGKYHQDKGDLTLKFGTDKPISLSKMPLGQSKFRQSFETFEIAGSVLGKMKSRREQDLKFEFQAGLIGNLVHPEMGDMKADVRGKIQGGRLSSDALAVSLKDGTLSADASLDLNELTGDVRFTFHKFDIKTVMRLFSSVNIPSLADGSGTFAGKLINPHVALNFTTDDASYEFLHFGPAQGTLLIDNKILKLGATASSLERGTARVDIDIKELYDSGIQDLDLRIKGDGLDIRQLLNAKSLDGRLTGEFHLDRIATKVAAEGKFKATSFRFFDRPVGEVSTNLLMRERHLELRPITIDLNDPNRTLATKSGLVFDFNDEGYAVTGHLFDALAATGNFRKASRERIQLKLTPKKLPLEIFTPLLPLKPGATSVLSATIDVDYHIYDPVASSMKSQMSEFILDLPEGLVKLTRTAGLDYQQQAFHFRNFQMMAFRGGVLLNGALGLNANSNLTIKGDVDFSALADFNPFVVDSEKPIALDLTFKGGLEKPMLYGKVIFNDSSLQLRKLAGDLEGMTGTLSFDGTRLLSQTLNLTYNDAPVRLSGSVTTDFKKLTASDLKISASEVPMRFPQGLDILADLNVELTGSNPLKISGKANIVDGLYRRNFGITNFILQPEVEDEEEETLDQWGPLSIDTAFDILIKNTGDFVIKNNIAEIEMSADMQLLGTIAEPALNGQIDFLSGTVNAFGINFEQATGLAQFSRKRGLDPVIDLTAKKDIQEFEVVAKILGTPDNLRLKLDSTPALDRRELLSMIVYGRPPDELTGDLRRQFSQAVAVSQLANVLSTPLYRVSGLDVFKVSTRAETVNDTVQRFSVGKRISNRLNLSFTTDLGVSNPERAMEFEYQVFDNFYLIAAKDLGETNRFRFDVNYRFEAY